MRNVDEIVRISVENENYDKFRDMDLVITNVATNTDQHPGYDVGMFPMALYDLRTLDGEDVPFSLYEYELENA